MKKNENWLKSYVKRLDKLLNREEMRKTSIEKMMKEHEKWMKDHEVRLRLHYNLIQRNWK